MVASSVALDFEDLARPRLTVEVADNGSGPLRLATVIIDDGPCRDGRHHALGGSVLGPRWRDCRRTFRTHRPEGDLRGGGRRRYDNASLQIVVDARQTAEYP